MNEAVKPPSDRTRMRRYYWLAQYERDVINRVIDAGIICQVGYIFNGQPYVTPTSHWRIGDYVYWHGSSASRMLKEQQKGVPVCFSVTHLDGIVFARAAMNHNVQFRSVMAFGEAELVEDDRKREVLAAFTNRLAPGLWDYARQPTEQEWRATKVLRLKLDEVSAKINGLMASDDEADCALDLWSGAFPLQVTQGPTMSDPKLAGHVVMPDFARDFRYDKIAETMKETI